jgi:hypothetical protein
MICSSREWLWLLSSEYCMLGIGDSSPDRLGADGHRRAGRAVRTVMVPLLQQGPYRDTSAGPATACTPRTDGRQIGAKASTEPVALRVRPRLRENGSTAQRDIEDGVRAKRFNVCDPEWAMVIIAGAALVLGQLLHDHPERDDAQATDQITEDLLRTLGLPPDEAHEICQRALPDLDGLRPQTDIHPPEQAAGRS